MIFVGGGVTVEGNGTQPVDVQAAVFGPEDARLAIRLETVAASPPPGPAAPRRTSASVCARRRRTPPAAGRCRRS